MVCFLNLSSIQSRAVESLHNHLCHWHTNPLDATEVMIKHIGIQVDTLKQHLEHCLENVNDEIQKLSGHIDSRESAIAYSNLSDDKFKLTMEIRFAKDAVDYFMNRQEYASYNMVTQLVLNSWEYLKTILATYSVLAMVVQQNPIENIPDNRYYLAEYIHIATEEWDF